MSVGDAQRANQADQKSGGSAQTLSRGFDGAGRIATQSGDGFSAAGSYAYDGGSGLKTAESLPLLLGGSISSSYDYAPDRRLAAATVGGVAGKYVFDGAGNLSFDTEGSTTTSFTYDAADRLTQTADGATTTVYGWNASNGWRTSQGPSANPTQIQYTYVKSGATTSNGRMTRYQNSATSSDASYAYDASGQRTRSAVTVGGVATTTNFTYDGLSLLSLAATQGSSTWRLDLNRPGFSGGSCVCVSPLRSPRCAHIGSDVPTARPRRAGASRDPLMSSTATTAAPLWARQRSP